MSPYQDDDFSKAYTTALYQTKGTVNINVRVKSDENLEIDLLGGLSTSRGIADGHSGN